MPNSMCQKICQIECQIESQHVSQIDKLSHEMTTMVDGFQLSPASTAALRLIAALTEQFVTTTTGWCWDG